MSWSVNYIGKPELINQALEAESARMSGQSKIEFDAAMPSLAALVASNFDIRAANPPLVKLVASGSGSATTDSQTGQPVQVQRSCSVSIEPFYSNIKMLV